MPTMKTLRDPDFQRLLEDYPRPQRTFIVASQVTDAVSSEWLIKGGDGRQYKPEDYLKAFAAFVRDEAEKIDALSVLSLAAQRLEALDADRRCATRSRPRPSTSPRRILSALTRPPTRRPWSTSSRWSSTPRSTPRRC